VFKYFLTPDFDFKQDILSFGTMVEILAPEKLRKEFCDIAQTLHDKYRMK